MGDFACEWFRFNAMAGDFDLLAIFLTIHLRIDSDYRHRVSVLHNVSAA
jgi:hypothetical protein